MNDSNSPLRRGQVRSNPRTFQPVSRSIVPLQPDRGLLPNLQQNTGSTKIISAKIQNQLSKTAAKAMLLSRAVQVKKPIIKQRKINPSKIVFTVLGLLVLAVLCYMGYDTWATHNKLNEQPTSDNTGVSAANASTDERQLQEGSDRNPLPTNALTSYKVAADSPRALYITKLGVAARILPMSVNKDNSIQAPINIFDAGWYTGSVKPGEKGAALVDGHSTADGRALFGKLDKLVSGDQIQLEKGDGTRLTYRVVQTETVDKDAVDMKKLLLPYAGAQRALNLITCSGAWNSAENTLAQRTIVYTEQI
jgi:LPXTG-site transpeptidase (sortase) family protein